MKTKMNGLGPRTARDITRRDFLNGVAWTVGAASLPLDLLMAQGAAQDPSSQEPFLAKGITQADPRYYPPALTGLRGSHPGSFEVAHQLRDGKRWPAATDTGERYDLVVVGAGISGLAAAYWFRKANGPQSKILILDNHDDFGGHAKRNEFKSGKQLLIGYGGTQSIEATPFYSKEAMGLLREIGIELKRFEKYYDQDFRKNCSLSSAVFFDKETFGRDALVTREAGGGFGERDIRVWQEFLSRTPLSEQAQKDILRLQTEKVDYFPGLSKPEKEARLKKMSFTTFLLETVKVNPQVVSFYQKRLHGIRGVGIEAIDALLCVQILAPAAAESMGLGEAWPSEPYIYHFPDGNASIARLLVRSLVPGSAPGHTMEDIVTARMNYACLDEASSSVRIRLNSTVVSAKNVGDPATAKEAEITYVLQGKAYKVRSSAAVLACWNSVIPYLCPEMPEKQKDGLSYSVKVPLVYTTVQLRNWKALQKLGVSTAYCPGCYFSEVNMDFPVSIGEYKYTQAPDQPCILHLVRTPCKPGGSYKEQYRVGRAELYTTRFETFEMKIKDQLGRMYAAGGFDADRDIEAITVNRWPHGYAYMYSPLWDPKLPEIEQPHVIGRQPFGRITIANADSGAFAETYVSLDQAYRAVQEVVAIRAHG